MNASQKFFVLYSTTSSASQAGLRPEVMADTAASIIAQAEHEFSGGVGSLEELAGVEWIEDAEGDMHPARELTEEEVLEFSVEKLGDDGRMYLVFEADEAGSKDFLDAAEWYGLADKAHRIVSKFLA